MTHDEMKRAVISITAPFPEARRIRDRVIEQLNLEEHERELLAARDGIIGELAETLLVAVQARPVRNSSALGRDETGGNFIEEAI